MRECSLGKVFIKKEAVNRIRKEEKLLMIIANKFGYIAKCMTCMKTPMENFNLESARTIGFKGGDKGNSIMYCSTSSVAREGTSLFFYLMGLSAARVPHTCPCVFSCRLGAVCMPHVPSSSITNTLQCAEIQRIPYP